MTDDKDGGSGSGTGDAAPGAAGAGAGAAPSSDAKNKTVKLNMDQVLAENNAFKKTVGEKDALIADLTGQLKEANDVLEGQQKSKLIGEIMARSSFKMDELVNRSVEDLQSIRATLDQAMPPKVNSVRFGVQSADLGDREKGLTVGDLSVVTAARRKAAQAGAA